MRRFAGGATALLLAAAAAPCGAAWGQSPATVVAGERYRADDWQEAILGRGYRDAWTTRLQVPLLDLDTVGGGLTPTERGGGNQTRSLRFRGRDGREYAFRSVDKDPVRTLGEDFQGTLAGWLLRDQVSAQMPAGQLALDVLEDAVGVMHPPRRIHVMPDDPRLGEFRQDFAGMLGYFEERPEEGNSAVPALGGAAAVESTEDFLEELASDARNRVDEPSYLTMRLVDLLIGDWDRHADQFRWVRFDQGDIRVWRPLPRDRDYAFADYGGVGLSLARAVYPKLVRFGPDPRTDLFGLFQNAQEMDRRVLNRITRREWDSVTAWVQLRLDDAVIDRAMARIPYEYAPARARIAARLRERRANLPGASSTLYEWLFVEPEVHAREQGDRVTAERRPDGMLELRMQAGEGTGAYYQRLFDPEETREVRIQLRGGDDVAVVRGAGPGRIGLRIVGGGGADVLADSSARGDTRFYDSEGENRFLTRPGNRVDRREYQAPDWNRGRGSLPPRDWGRSSSLFSPAFTWRSRVGPVIGAGPSWTDYGFRRQPVEDRGQLAALVAPLEGRVGVEYSGTYHFTGDRRRLEVDVRATGLVGTVFRGFGNETDSPEDSDAYRFFERQLLVRPTWFFPLGPTSWLSVGPRLELRDPEPAATAIARLDDVRGSERWGAAGAVLELELDGRDAEGFPRRGWYLSVDADGFPAVSELPDPFGSLQGEGRAYLSAGRGPVLALRAGGRAVWGGFPLQHAAYLGGRGSLRGFSSDRFAGDRAAFGGAELRQPLFRANLGIRGTIGALVMGDAGRVWKDGESAGGWHTAIGGGAYFNFLEGSRSAGLYVARGEETRFYAQLGIPF